MGCDLNSGWGKRLLGKTSARDHRDGPPDHRDGPHRDGPIACPSPERTRQHGSNSRVCAEFPYSHYYHDEELILREEGLKRQKEEASETTTTETPTPQQHSTSTFLLQNMIS